MADLTTFPLQDNYQSTLAQKWNGAIGTVYVNAVPSFTFPSWKKCYIVVNPEKANMQVARISEYDATAKTFTVDSISVNKGNGVAYTQQSHAVGSKVMISDNYQFRSDLATAIDSKVDTNSDDTAMWKFANAAARDAYFTSPVDWNSAYLIAEWKRTDRIWWSWVDRASGTNPNASTTVAWKVEKATSWEVTAWTATWWTWAELFVWPAELKTVTDWLTTSINAKPSIATDSEASTWTDTVKAVNSLQLKKYYWPAPIAWTTYTAATSTWWVSTTSTTYTKKAESTIFRTWTYTVSISAITWSSTWYIRIYKNWAAFWTERSTGTWWGSRSENLAFTEWDLVQVYMKHSIWWVEYIQLTWFTIQYSAFPMTITLI